MQITATELKMNLGKYLDMAITEDIYIEKNGHLVAKLSNPYNNRRQMVSELVGILPETATLEEGKDERMRKICEL